MNIIKMQTLSTSGEQVERLFLFGNQNICQRLFGWINSYFNRIRRWAVLQHFMEIFRYVTREVLAKKKVKKQGPNTLEELLTQFNLPKKEKTAEEVIRNYQVFLTMANLELEMLKMSPSLAFMGYQYWIDFEGTKFCDFVPCITRPEVVYCCYGKN